MKRCIMFAKGLAVLSGMGLLVACHSGSADPAAVTAGASQPSMERNKYDLAMQVAKAAEKSDNPEVGETALQEANKESPDTAEPVVMLAKLYVRTGEYQKAASWIEQNLPRFQKQPSVTSELQRQLGLAYWHLNQSTLAVTALVSAYPTAPKPELVLNDMGVLLDHFGKHRAAQACYQRGLKLNPDSDILMSNYAFSLLCSGDMGQAQRLLNNRVLISSSNQGILTNRDITVKLLKEGQREQQSDADMAAVFRRQFGFDKSQGQITQENFAAINTICQ